MVGTVVLGIFPKEQDCGDVFLYVLGCQRILRLEVDAVASATIAAALLHGKNTLVKASLDALQSEEVNHLLAKAAGRIQEGEFLDRELGEELAVIFERNPLKKKRPEYALFHIYLETLARLEAELHCIVLSGIGRVNASLVLKKTRSKERFSLSCPLGDALALALYADAPVGIVPALVQRALPVKTVLSSVPKEVQAMVEGIMPTPEKEAALQKRVDAYNAQPLVTVGGLSLEPNALHTALHEGTVEFFDEKEPWGKDDIRVRRIPSKKKVPVEKAVECACNGEHDEHDEHDDARLRKLLRNLTPETKVRM